MVKKKLLLLFTLFIISFSYIVQSATYDSGLLWEIENTLGKKSILFGTLHYNDDEVLEIFYLVKKYMTKASSINIEYIIEDDADILTAEKNIYKKSTHIKQHFTDDEYEKFLSLIRQKGIPLEEVEYSSFFDVFSIIFDPKLMTELHMDAQMAFYAIDNDIQLNGLEDAESVLNNITSFDLTYFLGAIKEVSKDPSIISDVIENTKKLYIEENLSALNDLFPKDFFEKMVSSRNKIMFDNLSKAVDEGNAFIGVGAAHLGGDLGLLNLLSEAGYTVTKIPLYS